MTDAVTGQETPHLCSGAEAAAAYQTVQHRVDTLLRHRADAAAERRVPACPGWSVRQTVSHLVGTAQDILASILDNAGTDAWTQAQLDRLAHHSLDELLDLWAQTIDPFTELLTQSPKLVAAQVVFDALTHEHDIRGALDQPGARADDPVFVVAAGFMTTMVDRTLRRKADPCLRLTTPGTGTTLLGDPATAAREIGVELSDFEALRAFGGRRSDRQLLALPWDADAAPLLAIFYSKVVRPPEHDLVEQG